MNSHARSHPTPSSSLDLGHCRGSAKVALFARSQYITGGPRSLVVLVKHRDRLALPIDITLPAYMELTDPYPLTASLWDCSAV